jgi:hypothetical protein
MPERPENKKAAPMVPSDITMPARPTRSKGFWPTRSITMMATMVISTLTTPIPTVARIEATSASPVDFMIVGAY